MSENRIDGKEPLWLLIEKEIQNYEAGDCSEDRRLATAKKIAAVLDETGYNVSRMAGNWLQLNAAIKARNAVGRPFIQDFDRSIDALTLESIESTDTSAWDIIHELSHDWPFLLKSEIRSDVKAMVRDRRVELVIAKARELGGEQGVRFLISEAFTPQRITETMNISEGDYTAVKAKVDAELAEIKRVKDLLASVDDRSEHEKIKHLLSEDVAEALILEVGGFGQAALDTAKTAMEKELAERKRQEEELAAKKAAEAAGPSLDEISPEDMLEYIEGLREILEFAGNEQEIIVMCKQSSIPKSLMDIAISDPDKLDELERQAEG